MAQAPAPLPAAPARDKVTLPRDNVTLIVRCTLLLLLVIGVLSIFGDSLLGLAGEAPPAPTGPERPAVVAPPDKAAAAR